MKIQHKKILVTAGVLLAAILSIAALIMFSEPIISLFSNSEKIQETISKAGIWGPLIYILLQITQIFIAPIPGQIVGLAGGYVFGTFWGTFNSMIGAAIGFTLVLLLSRKLGRPFVELFVSKKMLKKFDYLAESNGVMIFFLIFLLPGLPDDLICFIAGLTKIRLRTLIIISLIGRFPGYLALNFAGAGVAEADIKKLITITIVVAVFSIIVFWQKERIIKFVKNPCFFKKKNKK